MVAHPYSYGGPAGILPRIVVSPPPKINLHSLLNRNVPSILANYRRLQQEINLEHLNHLLELNSKPTESRNSDVYRNYENSTGNGGNSMSERETHGELRDCPQVPNKLIGGIFADINHTHDDNYTVESIASSNPETRNGGWWMPRGCAARHHVAIIIPFRDRTHHLMVLLAHLHPILQRQQIHYRIYVVEQAGNLTFNKARIMNIAFVTALKQYDSYGCFIFHDVDLIPENDRNMYACPQQPRHMSVAIDEMNYQVPYEELVGGVFAIRTEHFFKVNGYSNLYWGWGAEDDDMAYRLQHVGLKITRPPSQVARYKMIRHRKRPAVDGRIRYRLLWTGVRRYKIDGLNSLSSLNYKIVWIKEKPLFTHIMVDIGPPPPGF